MAMTKVETTERKRWISELRPEQSDAGLQSAQRPLRKPLPRLYFEQLHSATRQRQQRYQRSCSSWSWSRSRRAGADRLSELVVALAAVQRWGATAVVALQCQWATAALAWPHQSREAPLTRYRPPPCLQYQCAQQLQTCERLLPAQQLLWQLQPQTAPAAMPADARLGHQRGELAVAQRRQQDCCHHQKATQLLLQQHLLATTLPAQTH